MTTCTATLGTLHCTNATPLPHGHTYEASGGVHGRPVRDEE